jgi:hypothetical protein
VQEQFAEKFTETPVPHRNAVRRLIEKFRETGLYRRSWTSLPTPFVSAQRLSERTVLSSLLRLGLPSRLLLSGFPIKTLYGAKKNILQCLKLTMCAAAANSEVSKIPLW